MLLLLLRVERRSVLGSAGHKIMPQPVTSADLQCCRGLLREISALFALKDDVALEEGNGISVTC